MSFNLAAMVRESALAKPDVPVVRFAGESLTFQQLDDDSGRVASALLARGLRPGDRVAVQLSNRPEFLQAYFGVLKAGLVMVPMNPLFKAGEIGHLLRDSRARMIITLGLCLPEIAQAGAPDDLIVCCVDPVDAPVLPFAELLASEPSREIAATEPQDTAVIIYTSGTTGRPKGAQLSHFLLYMNCTISGELFEVQDGDVSLAVLPFFHIYGLSGMLNVAVRYGGTLAVVPRYDPQLIFDTMEREGVTIFVGVPTMYYGLLHADTGGRDLSKFRIASSGGASMPGAVMAAFEQKFGAPIIEGYGLSESGSTALMNRPGDRRELSIGKPIWGVQAKVAGPDGMELPAGAEHVGEILLKGHNIMKGYFGDPAGTAEALRDGWLHTGDLGYRDADGFFFVVDRIKDLIIRGGYNVYPREVEEVLYTHPSIAEAAVIGRPDERLGEEIVAVLAAKPGAQLDPDEILAYCRERLASYKCPREVRILDALPKTDTGKLLKRELRKF
jgi:long-chain acyl-CoA synthetase